MTTSHEKNMDVELPEPYNGRRDKQLIDHWLYKIGSNTKLPENKKGGIGMHPFLKDTAFLWWQRRISDRKSTNFSALFARPLNLQMQTFMPGLLSAT